MSAKDAILAREAAKRPAPPPPPPEPEKPKRTRRVVEVEPKELPTYFDAPDTTDEAPE